MNIRAGAFCALLLALPAARAAVETVYVQALPSVPLLSTPAAEAATVRRLAPGAPLTVLARQPGFVNVQAADGVQGWLRETEVTAVAPPAARVTQLEQEAAQLRGELAGVRRELASTEGRLRQAEQAAASARSSGADAAAGLEAERDRLQAALAERDTELRGLQQRVAELEMNQEATRLLAARQPKDSAGRNGRFSRGELLALGGGGLALVLLGTWLGSRGARRRLRQRYHGLEL